MGPQDLFLHKDLVTINGGNENNLYQYEAKLLTTEFHSLIREPFYHLQERQTRIDKVKHKIETPAYSQYTIPMLLLKYLVSRDVVK